MRSAMILRGSRSSSLSRWAPALSQKNFHSSSSSASSKTGVSKMSSLGNALEMNTSGGRSSVSGVVATVFGCSGFVGRYVVAKLGRIGSQVICPYRGDGMNTRHLKVQGELGQIVPVPIDMTDEASVMRSVDRSNTVINLIGSAHETDNYSYHDVHVKTTYRVCKLAKEAGVERFIHMSCINASEDNPSRFLQTKWEGEQVVKEFFPDATIIRSAPIYGEEDMFLNKIADMTRYTPVMPLLNEGQNLVQPIHVNDVAQAIMNSIRIPEAVGRTYNIAGNEVLTQKEIVDFVTEGIFIETHSAPVPTIAAKIAAKAFELLPRRWRLVNQDQIDLLTQDMVVRKKISGNGLEDLDVDPQPFAHKALETIIHNRQDRSYNKHGVFDRETSTSAEHFANGAKEGGARTRKYGNLDTF